MKLRLEKEMFARAQFSDDGKYVVVCIIASGNHRTLQQLHCYDTETGRQVFRIGDADFKMRLYDFWKIGTNDTLYAASQAMPGGKQLRGFRLTDGKEVSRIAVTGRRSLTDWTPDGKLLLAGTPNGYEIIDAKTGKPACTIDCRGLKRPSSAKFSNDGKRLVVVDQKGLRLFDAVTGEQIAAFAGAVFKDEPQLLSSGDGRIAVAYAIGTFPPKLVVADFENKTVLEGMKKLSVHRVALSPNGKYLAATNQNAATWVWDLTQSSTKPVAVLPAFNSTKFSPDGSILAADGFGCLTLFDTKTWKELPHSASPGSLIRRLRFTNDGKGLVGLGSNGWQFWEDWSKPSFKLIFGRANGHRSERSAISDDLQTVAEGIEPFSVAPAQPEKSEVRLFDRRTTQWRHI